MQNRTNRLKRVMLIVLSVAFAAILIFGITVFTVWHHEIATAASLKQIRARDDAHLDGAVYEMNVSGGFYLDEFVAQGGAKNDKELINFITGHITRGLLNMTIKESAIACSSFTARAENGDVLFGRNYDFSKTNTCVVRTQGGNGRHATISTVDLQFLGIDPDRGVNGLMDTITCLAAPYAPLDGISDAGLSCGIYMTYQGKPAVPTDQNTDKPDMTSTTMLRMMLDYASTVEEAVAIAKKYDLHDSAATSFHYMVADANGRSAVLEWVGDTNATDNDGSARRLVVVYHDGDENIGEREANSDFQWVTNFILQPGYYDNQEDMGGLDRYNRIYEELAPTNGVLADEQAAMDLLQIVGRRSWNPNGRSVTVHSVVYNLTQKSAMWVPNEHYDDPTAVRTYRIK